MQLGMIGLGRMGSNMVRRLIRGRPPMRGVRHVPKAVEELAKEKATGATSLAGFCKSSRSRVRSGSWFRPEL